MVVQLPRSNERPFVIRLFYFIFLYTHWKHISSYLWCSGLAQTVELSIQQWNKDKLANVEAIALLLMVIVFGLDTQYVDYYISTRYVESPDLLIYPPYPTRSYDLFICRTFVAEVGGDALH